MENLVIAPMRNSKRFLRIVSYVVIVAFGGLITAPAAAALREGPSLPTNSGGPSAPQVESSEKQLNQTLLTLRSKLRNTAKAISEHKDTSPAKADLKQLAAALKELDKTVKQNFGEMGAKIRQKKLPDVIAKRHSDMVKSYDDAMALLQDKLGRVETSANDEDLAKSIEELSQYIESHQLAPSQQPFDPNELPFSSLQPPANNKPKETRDEFIRSGLHNTPLPKYAAVGTFTYTDLVGANDPAYLAASDEVTLSPAIAAKAEALGHDPVAIYHWVRNNVEWLPTWGAIQDAELTLGSLRGNAMDIASLTAALLRASGIPTRYVHGTIDVPETIFRNWAGGFANVMEAANFAAAGGIPLTTVTTGGQISTIRMEHVWVEAAIDYFPSRGAVNRSADSWVAIDPSFKQYDFLSGLDVAQIAGLDGEALAQSFLDSGTVNEQEGWVQGFDPAIIAQAQTQAQQALQEHIATQMTDPTVGDVIGGRKTIVVQYPGLPSGLPYTIKLVGARYGKLPAALQASIELSLADDVGGQPIVAKRYAWAVLNNAKVTLSFKPATAEDEQALLALLPEGEITDISQLPTSIPAYLIKVIPELKVNGETVLEGNVLGLGEEVAFSFSVTMPSHGTKRYPSPVIAGSYLSIAVVGGSVSTETVNGVKSRLEATHTTLLSQDQALIAGLNREDLLGDMFYAGTLGYFAEYGAFAQLSAQQQKNHMSLAPSAGTYGYEPHVTYFFGIPRTIEPGGVVMDLDRVANITNTDGKGHDAWKDFNFQLGGLSSALEHGIPEQMFITPENPGEAVSAVKALAKATQQGQRIYHITPANQATVLPNIHHNDLTMSEIKNALAIGKEVITHTDAISVPGWSGAGYVIFDPNTGDGAWKIGGGENGSFFVSGALMGTAFGFLSIAAFSGANIGPAVFGLGLASAQLLVPLLVAFAILLSMQSDHIQQCFLGGFSLLFSAIFPNGKIGNLISRIFSAFGVYLSITGKLGENAQSCGIDI